MLTVDGNGAGPASLIEVRVSRLDQRPDARTVRVMLEGVVSLSASMTIALPAVDATPLVHAFTPADRGCSATCDLVLAPARRLEAAVVHAIIDDGPDGINAQLALGHDADSFVLACDVADALRLAVRAQAPIYATRRALDRPVLNGHAASQTTRHRDIDDHARAE
jgi:bifunctional DNase/RNase